jgi:hypothetical protein
MTTATMKKSEVGELRPSQLLLTFGVGAILDLPNMSVMVMGLDGLPPMPVACADQLEPVRAQNPTLTAPIKPATFTIARRRVDPPLLFRPGSSWPASTGTWMTFLGWTSSTVARPIAGDRFACTNWGCQARLLMSK